MKTINTLGKFARSISYSHNWVHYAAARLLSIQTTTDNEVWINSEWPIWKNLIIYMAPTMTGVLVIISSFIGFMRWFYFIPVRYLFGALNVLGFFWLGVCFLDYVEVVHFLIFRRWLEWEEKDDYQN